MPVVFSLREWLLEGSLGGARAGMSRDQLLATLGFPDDWGVDSPDRPDRAEIWRYGTFEVHLFADVVEFFFTDYLHRLEAGAGRSLDLWGLQDLDRLTLADVDALLRGAGGEPERGQDALGYPMLHVAGGADLYFTREDEGALWSAITSFAPGSAYRRRLRGTARPR